jgi:predicted dehydrogenase
MKRRTFLATAASAAVAGAQTPTVRVGMIGIGNRGTSLTRGLLNVPGVEIRAICDPVEERITAVSAILEKAGRPKPEPYSRGGDDYRRLLDRDDLDAVVIATPWQYHTPIALAAMRKKKYVAVEVPAALTVEECWKLVDTSEETGVPCMMLENWSFRRDNLAVLNMIRAGLLGRIVHCHCAHSHDCIDHWFFDKDGNDRWPAQFLVNRNADQYPTHSLGPVLSWMDINCGDAFASITSTASGSFGINAYFARRFGPDHPGAKRTYAQGDIVTSTVRTHNGKTVVINYDMQLPRPYDNRWMIQGTLGIYDEDRAVVYLTGKSPKYHEWEPFAPYQEKYEHSWWKKPAEGAAASHGGTDYLELAKFVEAVRARTQPPIDVYDSATMSAVVGLSEESIRRAGTLPFPDFTRGKWKTRKPRFAVEA